MTPTTAPRTTILGLAAALLAFAVALLGPGGGEVLLTREFLDPSIPFVAAFNLFAAVATLRMVPSVYKPRTHPATGAVLPPLALLASAGVAFAVSGDPAGVLFPLLVAAATCLTIGAALPRLTAAGVMDTARLPVSMICVTPWMYLFLVDLGFPDWSLRLALIGMGFAALLAPIAFATSLARDSLRTHGSWRRPTRPLAAAPPAPPKVSIHLPCHAEPPDVVNATLESLARLDYPDYEVIVCDNNTADEALWRPVARRCAALNRDLGFERFRFFHVTPLQGAKAGALNFCLRRTAYDAALIAVVDADYQAQPDFLTRLVGFFADPRVGFVQTSHDYREVEDGGFRTMCYWEYLPQYKLDLAGVQEYDGAYTIGTMCLLRKAALEAAGGWAEWCLTEDSEVAVRLRAAGYEGVYLRDTFGRGLVPETFADYKKQRFRWTAGPVQQLRRHWRLYLPRALGGSQMAGWAKLLELQHSLAELHFLKGPLTFLAATALGALIAEGELPRLRFPPEVWVALALGLVAAALRTWHDYALSGCRSLKKMIGGLVASRALVWIKLVGSLAGLSPQPLAWRRTPKFRAVGSGRRALACVLPESALCLLFLAMTWLPVRYWEELGHHAAPLALAGALFAAFSFACAPAMAWLRERELRKGGRRVAIVPPQAWA